jgi:hypothetical protein
MQSATVVVQSTRQQMGRVMARPNRTVAITVDSSTIDIVVNGQRRTVSALMTGSALYSELGASVASPLVCAGRTLRNDATTLHDQGVITNSVIVQITEIYGGVSV